MSERLVIVALDFASADQAMPLLEVLDPTHCAVKVGFELYIAAGPQFIELLHQRGYKVFLDLKLHDIPNTVASACRAAAQLGVWMVNVHALGGRAMIEAAREELDKLAQPPYLLAVTVLTSHTESSLADIGISTPLPELVLQFARQSAQWGADGVVCSAHEAYSLRQTLGEQFLLVTPGIRLPNDNVNDQKRVVTPRQAAQAGASHIVVGRPISRASNPSHALESFQKEFRLD